jgi:hypothetical protein
MANKCTMTGVRRSRSIVATALLAAACRDPGAAPSPRAPDAQGGVRTPGPPEGSAARVGDAGARRVSASFMDESGGFWGDVIRLAPDPADLVRGCLARFPGTRGFVEIAITPRASGSNALVARSSPVPDELARCFETALRAVHTVDSGVTVPAGAIVYASFD